MDKKLQVEKFEPITIGYGITVEIGEEDVGKVMDNLRERLKARIDWEIIKWKKPTQAAKKMKEEREPF